MPLLNASDVVATTSETDKIIYCGCMEDKTAAASHPQHCIGRTGDELTHVLRILRSRVGSSRGSCVGSTADPEV